MTTNKIILIGLSGAGKTTVAKQIATLLSWKHIDSDQMITE
ncbi:MAG: shikimate kinase, partial [Dehalococcoidaceae bacterium]|nr:shikimate kinase [Dehalococcoidaceae bacterium]